MKVFFAFLLIVFLAFSGYHLSFRKFKVPLFARKFYLTGLEFLFLGLLLGPQFLNILDAKTCEGLTPVTALLLGWIGMLFGFQFELSELKRFPLVFFEAAIVEGLLTLMIVFAGVYMTLPFFLDISDHLKNCISIVLASAAACTAQTGLAFVSKKNIGNHQATVKLLRYLSSIDGLIAMLALLFLFIYFPERHSVATQNAILESDTFIAAASFAGIIILFNLFLIHRKNQNELALIIIGMTIFISGFASAIHFSPLVASFFVGVLLVNLTPEKEKIFNTLVSIEKPVYLLLLVFLGSAWHFESVWIVSIAAGYCLLRFFGKVIGGAAISKLGTKMKTYPVGIGFGLIEQGGLPLAILYDFQQGCIFEVTGAVVGIALIAIIYNDLLSPNLLKRLF